MGDRGDIFGGLVRPRRPRRPVTGRRPRGRHRTEVHLTFEDAVRGVTTRSTSPRTPAATPADGSLPAAGHQDPTPARAAATGASLHDNPGMFSLARSARNATGGAPSGIPPSPTCSGSGRAPSTVGEVRSPPGSRRPEDPVKEAGRPARIRLAANSTTSSGRRPPCVHWPRPEPDADRAGRASPRRPSGTTVTMPTLDGPVTLRVPTPHLLRRRLRVRAGGCPAGKKGGCRGPARRRRGRRCPEDLTDEQ